MPVMALIEVAIGTPVTEQPPSSAALAVQRPARLVS